MENMPQQMMEKLAFAPENAGGVIAFLLAMTLGFLLYVWAIRLTLREKRSPYPIWIHCFFLAIDLTGAFYFWYLNFAYNFFWVFTLLSIGLPVWVLLETWCLFHAVKDERQEQFGSFYKDPVTKKQAWIRILGMILVNLAIQNWVLMMLGGFENAAMFMFYPFTNFILSFGTVTFLQTREAQGSRRGLSVMLQIIIFVTITVQWVPALSWYLIVSPFFDNVFFYICGITCSLVALYNIICLVKTPKKVQIDGEKKPIW